MQCYCSFECMHPLVSMAEIFVPIACHTILAILYTCTAHVSIHIKGRGVYTGACNASNYDNKKRLHKHWVPSSANSTA